ncbi:MAG: hypothetical protein EOP87_10895 [Verrucomicrobiaceae bacterium]|nr:MAG: hypothetical protein EOP87_10895 [Verrucomicrobiaceae bacterium]
MALATGAGIGFLLVHLTTAEPQAAGESISAGDMRSPRMPETVAAVTDRLISAASPAMEEGRPINSGLDLLFAERKSPMRTRAFLNSRIQMMTPDQLLRILMNGDVRSQPELEAIARRLARENPEATFDLYNAGRLQLYGMESIYTFTDNFLRTWGETSTDAVISRLAKMKRGGSQQDLTLRFSDHLARTNPEAAARDFTRIVYLRNMQDTGDMTFTHDRFAAEILRSWSTKDEAGMRGFVEGLPPSSPERATFDRAAKKLPNEQE